MSDVRDGQYLFISRVSQEVPVALAGVDVAFVGGSVDERGHASIAALEKVSGTVYRLRFDAANQQAFIDDRPVLRDAFSKIINGKGRIILDATTLGLGEILQVLLVAKRVSSAVIEFLYAEPARYTRREGVVDDRMRDFSLTQNCHFQSVQGFAHEYDPSMRASHVFLLGFEPGRIRNAIEQRGDFDPDRYRFQMVIGVPAFQVGWESNTIRPHLAVLEDLDITERSIVYCQANSIRESYLTLWALYRQLGDERGCFFVSPLGTKPHAVGAALFLLETKGNEIPTSLYYDHPERVIKRTTEVSAWHHVVVQLSS
ncbi:hypothetical protein [Pseudomonas jessenii]|uniref:hypothetical protein n=1 Tax=Pseudomonas jessenii TaxID=77298 RepID=UPI003891DA21